MSDLFTKKDTQKETRICGGFVSGEVEDLSRVDYNIRVVGVRREEEGMFFSFHHLSGVEIRRWILSTPFLIFQFIPTSSHPFLVCFRCLLSKLNSIVNHVYSSNSIVFFLSHHLTSSPSFHIIIFFLSHHLGGLLT